MVDELEFFGFSYIFFFFWPGVFSNLLPVFNWITHLSFFFWCRSRSSLCILGASPWPGACIANIFSLSVWLLKFSFLCHPANLYLTDLHGHQISASTPNSPPSTFLLQRHKCHDVTDLKGALFFVPSCGESCCCQCPLTDAG